MILLGKFIFVIIFFCLYCDMLFIVNIEEKLKFIMCFSGYKVIINNCVRFLFKFEVILVLNEVMLLLVLWRLSY